MKSAVTFRVTVIDGRANVELVAGEGCQVDASDPSGHFQVVEEGHSLNVAIGLDQIKARVFHPDIDYLITKSEIDPKKLSLSIEPPKINFEMKREEVEEKA